MQHQTKSIHFAPSKNAIFEENYACRSLAFGFFLSFLFHEFRFSTINLSGGFRKWNTQLHINGTKHRVESRE